MLSPIVIAELKAKYSQTTLSVVLCNGLSPVGQCPREVSAQSDQPAYLQGTDTSIIVFPPASDNPSGDNRLNSIKFNIEQALALSATQSINITSKQMIFPIAEELSILSAVPLLYLLPVPMRNHWVTLHYDPTTQTAVVIDSRPRINSQSYNLEPMRAALQEGLTLLGLTVNSISLTCQNVQQDDIHCGAWTAANIMTLANGEPLTRESLPTTTQVVEANTLLANKEPHNVIYNLSSLHTDADDDLPDCEYEEEEENSQPMTDASLGGKKVTLRKNDSLGSFGTTTTEGSSNDDLVGMPDAVDEAFSEEKQLQWLDAAEQEFFLCMHYPKKQLDGMFARENIRFNGEHIKTALKPLPSDFNLQGMLTELEAKYPNIKEFGQTAPSDRFSFASRGHPYPKLQQIGIADTILDSLSLSDAIRYETAFFNAASIEASHLACTKFQTGQEFTGEEEERYMKARAARNSFEQRLDSHLKQLILNEYAVKSAVLPAETGQFLRRTRAGGQLFPGDLAPISEGHESLSSSVASLAPTMPVLKEIATQTDVSRADMQKAEQLIDSLQTSLMIKGEEYTGLLNSEQQKPLAAQARIEELEVQNSQPDLIAQARISELEGLSVTEKALTEAAQTQISELTEQMTQQGQTAQARVLELEELNAQPDLIAQARITELEGLSATEKALTQTAQARISELEGLSVTEKTLTQTAQAQVLELEERSAHQGRTAQTRITELQERIAQQSLTAQTRALEVEGLNITKQTRILELEEQNAQQALLGQSAFPINQQQTQATVDEAQNLSDEAINQEPHSFLKGISLEILGGFAAVIGISAVALAITALCAGTLGLIPAASCIIAGVALATTGFFSIQKGAVDVLHVTEQHQPNALH